MKGFRKKSSSLASPWHVDFRNPTTLPDVKLVRTSFFVNGMAVLAFTVVALYLGFKEYGRYTLREEIAALEARIQEHTPRNNEVLQLHRSFQGEERYIHEVAKYLDDSLQASELLIALSESLYPGMSFTAVRYEDVSERGRVVGKKLHIHGAIQANPDMAASAITEYLNAFHQHPLLASLGAEAVPTSLVPAREAERMAFGIEVTLKGQKEEAKK